MASSGYDVGKPAGQERQGRTDVRLETILQQMPTGVAVAEAPGGRLIHVNERIEQIWRRSFDEVTGVEDYGVWQGLHTDGRDFRPDEWPLARALATGETVEAQDIDIRRGDGSRAVVRVSASPVRDEMGRISAAVLTCSDVTEQKRRDAVRRLLAETSGALAASLDYQATLRNVARSLVPALGDWCSVDMVGEAEGIERLVEHAGADPDAPVRELPRHHPVQEDSARGIGRVLRSGAAELVTEVDEELLRSLAHDEEQVRLLRELRPRSAMIVPLVARGRILGAIGLVAAESRRRYGAEDLELAQELAVRAGLALDNARLYDESQGANRAKADFLAVISHELRTPLTAIIGYSELLSLGVPEPVTERQKEQVERIEVAARHLQQLIEEILTMASLETGEARIRSERVQVRELLRRAEVITEPLARAKELSLRVEPVDPDLAVQSDPDKLLQILLNLLSNAVKFTEHGGITLSARQEGGHLEVEVRDSGIGVEPRHRERIFDPFWQVEQPITRKAGGTGLGLAISRRLVELLGGDIHMRDNPEAGSIFVMRVPLGAKGE